MENQSKAHRNLWKPPSFEDFNLESQCKRIKLDNSELGKVKDSSESEIANEPRSVDELATHPKKIQELKTWFEETTDLKAPILLVTGPAGSAKTATVRVVASSLNISLREWLNPMDKVAFGSESSEGGKSDFRECRQTDKFEDFVFRASRYRPLFDEDSSRSVVLVEDFPNVYVWKPKLFHDFLEKYRKDGKSGIVFVCTDDRNLNLPSDLFPGSVKSKFNVTEVKFNPVNQSSLVRTLKKAMTTNCRDKRRHLSADGLQVIAQNSGGDLRTALSNLSIILSGPAAEGKRATSRKRETAKDRSRAAPNVEPMSVKDAKVEFYQSLGRILYPKRIGAEFRDKSDGESRIFVHNVTELADDFGDSHLTLLHENYVSTFGDVGSIAEAAGLFSFCDALRCVENCAPYAALAITVGLMLANERPKRQGFKPIRKSGAPFMGDGDVRAKRFEYGRYNATCRVLDTDIIPYLNAFRKLGRAEVDPENCRLNADDESDVEIEDFDD